MEGELFVHKISKDHKKQGILTNITSLNTLLATSIEVYFGIKLSVTVNMLKVK